MQRASFPTFAGGEISEAVAARFDVAKYQTALKRGRNVFGLVTGGQYNRPGMEYCDYSADNSFKSELFDFSYSDDQSYCLEFTQEKMRVFYDGLPVVSAGLEISAATNANPLTVTVPDHDYVVGNRIYFYDVTGMTGINGRILKITGIVGDVLTFAGVNSTAWGAFTGSGGGLPGAPTPPADPPAPDFPPVDPVRPPTGDIPLTVDPI